MQPGESSSSPGWLGFERLGTWGSRAKLDLVAEAAAERAGAKANPRPASPQQIADLLRSVW